MAIQVVQAVHVCAGYLKGKRSGCANCGHPRKQHMDESLNSARYCRECIRVWRLGLLLRL